MPYVIKKHAHGWSVVNHQTGHIYSKHTTEEKAKKQRKLLEAIERRKKFFV